MTEWLASDQHVDRFRALVSGNAVSCGRSVAGNSSTLSEQGAAGRQHHLLRQDAENKLQVTKPGNGFKNGFHSVMIKGSANDSCMDDLHVQYQHHNTLHAAGLVHIVISCRCSLDMSGCTNSFPSSMLRRGIALELISDDQQTPKR